MDVPAVTGNSNIGGISQPIIGQTQNRTRNPPEGRRSQSARRHLRETRTLSPSAACPGSRKFLCSSICSLRPNVEHKENEIVFVLIPHIVRGQELSDLNERTIEVGNRQRHRPPSRCPPAPCSWRRRFSHDRALPLPFSPCPHLQPRHQQSRPLRMQHLPGVLQLQHRVHDGSANRERSARLDLRHERSNLRRAENVYSVPVQLALIPRLFKSSTCPTAASSRRMAKLVAIVHREDPSTGTIQVNATRPPGGARRGRAGHRLYSDLYGQTSGRSMVTITQGRVQKIQACKRFPFPPRRLPLPFSSGDLVSLWRSPVCRS